MDAAPLTAGGALLHSCRKRAVQALLERLAREKDRFRTKPLIALSDGRPDDYWTLVSDVRRLPVKVADIYRRPTA